MFRLNIYIILMDNHNNEKKHWLEICSVMNCSSPDEWHLHSMQLSCDI